MSLPLFYHDASLHAGAEIWLDEDTARHIVQVLRMQVGEDLRLTDGKGIMATVAITTTEKKKCRVVVHQAETIPPVSFPFHLGVAFTKNTSRNEWLLEKATELGVRSIIPLATKRTEREKMRYDRWHNILVSAMLQSQQAYLPRLSETAQLNKLVEQYPDVSQKLLAHCMSDKERLPLTGMLKPQRETILLIGPEGDFTEEEVTLLEGHGYKGVSLGSQRLRTETAAMAVCAYHNLINNA